jgi:hypothetical protein
MNFKFRVFVFIKSNKRASSFGQELPTTMVKVSF